MGAGRVTRGTGLAVLLLAAACGGGGGAPRWIHLAEGFRPEPLSASEGRTLAMDPGSGALVLPGADGGLWVECPVRPEAWRTGTWEGIWSAPLPLDAGVRRTRSLTVRVTSPAGGYERSEVGRREAESCPSGHYFLTRGTVHVRPHGAEPPRDVSFAFRTSWGDERDGRWRTTLGGVTGDGLPALPGRPTVVSRDVPAGSALRFGLAVRGLREDVEVVARVRVDGEELFVHRGRAGVEPGLTWCAVPLGPRARRGARIAFEIEPGPCLGAWISPIVGPAEPEAVERTRPDVVLFLADTFRADLMAGYGEATGATPLLDRLAEESRLFPQAWAPATWTLPSQVSMLTGAYPPQHGVVRPRLSIPAGLTTLAERLAAFGYRTGAVTDSGYVSRVYGFDRGFEFFQEYPERFLSSTLETATEFLAADDGRPTFLFFQTYRTHVPYRTGSEEDERRYREIVERHGLDLEGAEGGVEGSRVPPEAAAALYDAYVDTARDLDRKVGGWVDGLERGGFFENGFLVLTSDHGEAFLEHGEFGHGRTPWEEKIRVPLLVRGPGLAAGEDGRPASLIDLPATLAALAGVPGAPEWGGESLVAPVSPGTVRPVLAFDGATIAVMEDGRKLLLRTEGDGVLVRSAFDLAADPGERRDLAAEGLEWPARRSQELVPTLERLTRPLARPEAVELGAEERDRLRALGYADE